MISNSMKEDLRQAMEDQKGRKPVQPAAAQPSSAIKSGESSEKKVSDAASANPAQNDVSGSVSDKTSASSAAPVPSFKVPSPPATVSMLADAADSDPDKSDSKTEILEELEEGLVKNINSFKKKSFMKRSFNKKLAAKLLIIFVCVALFVLVLYRFQNSKTNNNPSSGNQSQTASDNQSDQNNSNPADKELSTEKQNDSERISDINTIATSVGLYCLMEKVEMPISAAYVKLNDDSTVSEFVNSALKKYSKPEDTVLDPQNPDFYYAYRSLDGKTAEFTARMEDDSSTQCDASQKDVCLYKKALDEEYLEYLRATVFLDSEDEQQ